MMDPLPPGGGRRMKLVPEEAGVHVESTIIDLEPRPIGYQQRNEMELPLARVGSAFDSTTDTSGNITLPIIAPSGREQSILLQQQNSNTDAILSSLAASMVPQSLFPFGTAQSAISMSLPQAATLNERVQPQQFLGTNIEHHQQIQNLNQNQNHYQQILIGNQNMNRSFGQDLGLLQTAFGTSNLQANALHQFSQLGQQASAPTTNASSFGGEESVVSSILPSVVSRSPTNSEGASNHHLLETRQDIKLHSEQQPLLLAAAAARYLGGSTSPTPSSNSEAPESTYTPYQSGRWKQRFNELLAFKREYGHCRIPSHWPQHAALAQWVKRQRSQWKLKREGRHSNMTDERQKALEAVGFVWDSHFVYWEERLNELKEFATKYGHANVPSKFPENQQLAVWCKCQRRQFKLFSMKDPRSNMTPERIQKLLDVGFVFVPKKGKKKRVPTESHVAL